MGLTQTGNNLSTPIDIVGDVVTWNETEKSIRRTVRALYPDYLAELPTNGDPSPIAQMPLCVYKGATVQENAQVGQIADYVLLYRQEEPDSGEIPPPRIIRRRCAITEKDLREHPEFDSQVEPNWDKFSERIFTDGTIDQSLRGRRTFPQIDSEVVVTTFYSTDPGSIQARLGAIATPPGETAAENWKVLDGWNGLEGRWWAETLVYRYNLCGWNTVIDAAPPY